MGFGGISLTSLLVILAIVLLLFGTKKLRNLGGDVGGAIRGFKDAMRDGEQQQVEHKQAEGSKAEQPASHDRHSS